MPYEEGEKSGLWLPKKSEPRCVAFGSRRGVGVWGTGRLVGGSRAAGQRGGWTVRGRVRTPVVVERRVVEFGEVISGSTVKAEKVRIRHHKDCQVARVWAEPEVVEISVAKDEELEGCMWLDILPCRELPVGPFRTGIRIAVQTKEGCQMTFRSLVVSG